MVTSPEDPDEVGYVAYAAHNYWRRTGDDRFLRSEGIEINVEGARVVLGWPGTSQMSPERIPVFTPQIQACGVESVGALLQPCRNVHRVAADRVVAGDRAAFFAHGPKSPDLKVTGKGEACLRPRSLRRSRTRNKGQDALRPYAMGASLL